MATKRTYAELLALAKARETGTGKVEPGKPEQLNLELWPDAVRGVPNSVLRGALFGVSKTRKTHKKRVLIASTGDYEIRFLGTTLNQTDLDTFQGMLHLAMPHALGTRVEFAVHAFLKNQRRGTGKTQHEQFKEEVMRLVSGGVEITYLREKKTFIGTLVSKVFRDEETGRYVVVFNEDMLKLYQTGYTLIDWEQRQALGQNSLAKWLHNFYSTHAAPFPYKAETLKKLCGSDVERLGDFRKLLRNALAKLVEISALTSWAIDAADMVHVVRVATKSQNRHIARKTSR